MRGRGAAGTLALLLALGAAGPLAAQAVPGATAPQVAPQTPVPDQAGQAVASAGGLAAPSNAAPDPASPDPAWQPGMILPVAGPQAATPPTVVTGALLTIDQDALYHESAWGQRAQADLEARSRAVSAENDRIAAALEREDDDLTALRPTLPPNEFRRRADAFDAHVQQVRQERDQVGRDLLDQAEQDRAAFLNAALPLFTAIMRERGALAILDRRTVFLSADAVDITAAMIARIDAQLGDGKGVAGQGTEGQDAAPQSAADQGQSGQDGAEGAGQAAPDAGNSGPDQSASAAPEVPATGATAPTQP